MLIDTAVNGYQVVYRYSREMHDRLYRIRKQLKLSQRRMAKSIGYSATMYCKLESHPDQYISEHVALCISLRHGISLRYLLFGEGDMFHVPDERRRELSEIFDLLSEDLKEDIMQYADYLLKKQRARGRKD